MIKTELTNAVSTLGALQGLRLFLAVRKDPLRGFCDLQQKYSDFIRWKGPYTTYQLTHPADVQHVLQTNPGNYHKGRNYRISREYSAQRSWALMKLPESFPTPRNRRYHDAVRRSFAVVSELIEERRRHPGKYADVLAMLLEARDPET